MKIVGNVGTAHCLAQIATGRNSLRHRLCYRTPVAIWWVTTCRRRSVLGRERSARLRPASATNRVAASRRGESSTSSSACPDLDAPTVPSANCANMRLYAGSLASRVRRLHGPDCALRWNCTRQLHRDEISVTTSAFVHGLSPTRPRAPRKPIGLSLRCEVGALGLLRRTRLRSPRRHRTEIVGREPRRNENARGLRRSSARLAVHDDRRACSELCQTRLKCLHRNVPRALDMSCTELGFGPNVEQRRAGRHELPRAGAVDMHDACCHIARSTVVA